MNSITARQTAWNFYLATAARYKWLILLCALGFIINLIAFYPGFMSPDTFDQYGQALSGRYRSWHPPLLAFTWRLLSPLHRGPVPMLLLQLFFLWTSCFLVGSLRRSITWQISICMVFLFAPFLQNFAGWVIKDAEMSLAWLLACSMMLRAAFLNGTRYKLFFGIASAGLLLYGSWMRYNAVAGLPSLCIAWSWIFFYRLKRFARIAVAVFLLVVIQLGQDVFVFRILHATKERTEALVYIHDLNGIFVSTHQNVYPELLFINNTFDTAYIRKHYDSIDISSLLWNKDNKQFLPLNQEAADALKTAWLNAIKLHFNTYLHNRWDIYLHFLGLKKNPPLQYYFAWISENNYGLTVHSERPLHRLFVNYMEWKGNWLFFQVWFWIFLNVLLLPASLFVRDKRAKLLAFCIAASGFLYTLPQFLLCSSVNDFRYIYWGCLACMLAIIIMLYGRYVQHREPAYIHMPVDNPVRNALQVSRW